MQSDVVSGDPCSEGAEFKGGADVPLDETLVWEERLESERDSKGMEVGTVGQGVSKVGSDSLSNRIETSSMEGVNDACVEKEGKDLGINPVAVEVVINQDNSVMSSFNLFAQQLFPNPVTVDRSGKDVEAKKIVESRSIEVKRLAATSDKEDCGGFGVDVDRSGKEVEAKKTVESHSVEVKRLAITSDKEDCRVDVEGGGVSELKRVSLVDLDECVRNYKKKGIKKGGFCVSDLVWGKVKSHPWWPAQIFDSGDASDKARKYSKSKGYFVCYFGDQTFAWNDEAKLKSFAPNFSHMVKQTQMEAFRHAVDCVLDETSRRVESGLSCRCISDDVYNRLKTQVVQNAGIREESRIQVVGDRFFTASSFEPVKLLDYVKHLAQRPQADVDRLEHVVARAQMAAFYRWKGIYHLAEFGYLVGYVNNEADAPVTAIKEKVEVIADEAPPPETIEEVDITPQKRKKISSDSGHSTKKVRCLSDLVGKKGVQKKDEKETKVKASSKSMSSSAWKQKEVKSLPIDSKTKECSSLGTTKQFKDTKPSFRVGESILRVAGQLSQPSPLLKLDVSFPENTIKDEGNGKQHGKHTFVYGSLDVILSELHLVAIEPLKEHCLLSKMVTFISHFRNSIVPDSELLQKHEESGEEDTSDSPLEELSGSGPAEMDAEGCFSGAKTKSKASNSGITATSDFEAVEFACCTNKTIEVLEQQASLSDVQMTVVEPEHSEVDGISVCSQATVSSPQQHYRSENGSSEGGQFYAKTQHDDSPTALTLKFTDMDAIPTEAKLIKIFSHFGPLKESETEVLVKKQCARVVFKRRSDAETAFSSSGKFEIFGPSLVCYRLNYAPSPRKSPLAEAKRRKKN